jgi:hypothetical protein
MFHTTATHSATRVKIGYWHRKGDRKVKETRLGLVGRVSVASRASVVIALVLLKIAHSDHSFERELIAVIFPAS